MILGSTVELSREINRPMVFLDPASMRNTPHAHPLTVNEPIEFESLSFGRSPSPKTTP
jgi:hypothetical protein